MSVHEINAKQKKNKRRQQMLFKFLDLFKNELHFNEKKFAILSYYLVGLINEIQIKKKTKRILLYNVYLANRFLCECT